MIVFPLLLTGCNFWEYRFKINNEYWLEHSKHCDSITMKSGAGFSRDQENHPSVGYVCEIGWDSDFIIIKSNGIKRTNLLSDINSVGKDNEHIDFFIIDQRTSGIVRVI